MRYTGIGKLICLGGILLLVTIFSSSCSKDWQSYQKEYNRQVAGSGREIEAGVKTISYPELQVEDRCISCHVGLTDVQMAGAKQPLTTHPGRLLNQHDWQKIGCTICHGGNGEELSRASAHQSLLKAEMVQTTCHRCHPRPQKLKGAPNLTHGKMLFEDWQCSGCHFVQGLSTQRRGPSLNGIGSRTNRKWLKFWLKNPKEMISNAKMPGFFLSAEYADALAAYLMTFRDAELESRPEPPEGDPTEGGNILRRARCISCHPFNGRGGYLAPDLGRSGNKTNRKFIYAKIENPAHYEPGSTMSQFNLSPQQLADVTDYLMEEYTDYDLLDIFDEDSSAAKTDSATIDLGRRLYKELRCNSCHFLDNGMEWMQVGPKLSNIGEKPLAEIDFGSSQIPRSREDYLFEKIRNPRAFATPGHPQKMPQFNLDNHDAYDLTLFLLSLNSDSVASPRFAAYPDTTLYRPGGEYGRLVEKFQCFSCHRIYRRGFNLAYDLSIEGSRVSRRWLYDYLMVSYSIRPILVERMPIFNFTDHEARVLTDHIMENYTAGWAARHPEKEFTPDLAAEGERLVEEKGCLACHIRGDKGGYLGPSFTTGAFAGDKLQAEWIYQWLKDPQKIVPGVLEPNYGLSDHESLAITAYLMSLKQ